METESWRTKTLLLGGIIGALVGLSAAYLLVQRAEKEQGRLQMNAGEGIKLGLLVLGLLRQVAQLGEGS
ncbi:MAG: hypothetical protein DDG59_07880 [Anaerolineae bacterium]|jgi:hypothetical protein|nr:MAG: hypothetical protein DDG59_07880 [Anaerolineae bacterium]